MLKYCAILFLFVILSFAESNDRSVSLTPLGGQLDGATSLSITPTGNMYITESNKHRFLVYNSVGIRVDSVGSQGRGDYRFDRPVSIHATNGLRIFVADRNNSRVQLFDRRHQYLTSISAGNIDRQAQFKPTLLTVSSSNELFVFDPDRFVVYKFDANGNYSRELNLRQFSVRNLNQLKISGSLLLLLDSRQGVIHRFSGDGGYLNFISGFDGVKAIHATESEIWALFEDRIDKFTIRGAVIESYRFADPLAGITDLHIAGNRAYILTENQLYRTAVE